MTNQHRAGPLAYRERGEGPVLLLVHGFPLDSGMWQAQIDELGQDYRVLAPDLRGFGASDPLGSAAALPMERMADDLADLLDALGIGEPVALCGLSMGGYVALAFWSRHAARLGALALCDSKAAGDDATGKRARESSAEAALAGDLESLCEAMLPKLFAAETSRGAPKLVADTAKVMRGTAPETFAAAQRGMAMRADMRPRLAEIGVPSLLLCGAEDGIATPAEMREIAGAMPDAQFVEIPGAGHLSPLEAPQAVNQALRRWLR